MSSTAPKDIVRQFLDAIAGGDGKTMLGLMADDAVMITPGSPKVPFNGRFEGKASITHAFTMFGEYLEIRDHTLKLLFGEGEHVGVMINETSRAKRTDRFIKQDTFWYFHITGGFIQSWQVFEDTEQVGWAWDDRATRRVE
ncbi:MAG: SnoaL-like domain-containing protein [Rhodospirillaceae bacterium]|jgi:ketosteroid isomerase-like protein|nr:SnoaL-like domain-containing protein [Rhodospirillaceae bacterium]MBT5675862.1 SnoaL-like domain-containing protein [Rhodospirillaceae bacterium]MBT6828178.1 SnoaL-like domain-containing protein [Rhodospirillaceae bacterium]